MLSTRPVTTVTPDASSAVDAGTAVTVHVATFNRLGEPDDKDVAGAVTAPDGTTTDLDCIRDGAGAYRLVVATPSVGDYRWRVKAGTFTAFGALTAV